MKSKYLFIVFSLLLVISFITFLVVIAKGKQESMYSDDIIKRGEYLVNMTLCNDCHSPKIFTPNGPEPDTEKLLSGHPEGTILPEIPQALFTPDKWGGVFSNHFTAWVGPWGISFSANLTPDEQTGLGLWTEELFIKSMRTGKHMGAGRPILPPMPWTYYSKMSDDELKAIFAYLKSLKPVRNLVPPPIPPA